MDIKNIYKESNFNTNYKGSYNDGVQYEVSKDKVFRQYKLSKEREPFPQEGDFFKYQKSFREYEKLLGMNSLIIDQMGAGKTCKVISFTDYCRDQRIKALLGHKDINERCARFKKCVYLVKSDMHIDDLRSQIFCDCTTYYKERQKETTGYFSLPSVISEFYEIITFKKFFNELKGKSEIKHEKSGGYYISILNSILEKYNDCIIIFDEVHVLTAMNEEIEEIPSKEDEEEDETEKEERYIREIKYCENGFIDVTSESDISVDKWSLTKKNIYFMLHTLFHSIERSIIILMTGTPMVNKIVELIPIINLIVPTKGKMPIDYDYKNASHDEIKFVFPNFNKNPNEISNLIPEEASKFYNPQIRTNYFDLYNIEELDDIEELLKALNYVLRGKVSYVGGEGIGISLKEISNSNDESYNIKNSNMKFYHNRMSEFQYKVYMENLGKRGWGKNLLSASMFAFPNGKTGKQAYKDYIENKVLEKELNDSVRTLEDLKEYSCFMYNVIKSISEFFKKEDEIEVRKGIIYIYIQSIWEQRLFAKFLEKYLHMEKFIRKESVFLEDKEKKQFCPSKLERGRKIDSNLDLKKRRYAIFDASIETNLKKVIKEVLRADENYNGGIIKVFICSSAGREGINVKHALEAHMTPEWNMSNIEQSDGRIKRVNSFDELQRRFPQEKFVLKIYRHVVLPPYRNEKEDMKMIHYNQYRVAIEKDFSIKRVMNILKRIAFDAQLNRERNIKGTVDFSVLCDYSLCKYKYSEKEALKKDITTVNYNLLFVQDIINNYRDRIIDFLRKNRFSTLEQMINAEFIEKKDFSLDYILIILENLIDEKYIIKDNFGIDCYVEEGGGYFYLTRDFSEKTDFMDSYYIDRDFPSEKKSLDDVIEELIKEFSQEKLEILGEFKYDMWITTMEKILISGGITNDEKDLIKDLSFFVFEIEDQKHLIDKLNREFEIKKIGRGRPPKITQEENISRDFARFLDKYYDPEKKKGIQNIKNTKINEEIQKFNDLFIKEGNKVLLHSLYSLKEHTTEPDKKSRIMKAEGTIRIFDKNIGKWRSIENNREYGIYNILIQLSINNKIENIIKEMKLKSRKTYVDYYLLQIEDKYYFVNEKLNRNLREKGIVDIRKYSTGKDTLKNEDYKNMSDFLGENIDEQNYIERMGYHGFILSITP